MASTLLGRARTGLLFLLLMLVLIPAVQAQEPQTLLLPRKGTPGPIALAQTSDHRTTAAWWSLSDDGATLLYAPDVDGDPTILLRETHAGTLLALSPAGEFGWTTILGQGVSIHRRAVDGETSAVVVDVAPSALAFDAAGKLCWADVSEGQVRAASPDTPEPRSIGALDRVDDLALGVDGQGRIIAAASGETTAEGRGIYLLANGKATLVAPDARQPRLVVDSGGHAYLAWRSENGLGYANSSAWQAHTLVEVEGLTAWDLAVDDQGEAYLAWAQGDALWLARGSDPAQRHKVGVAEGEVQSLALSIAADGVPHLLWVATAEDGTATLSHATLYPLSAQVRVVSADQTTLFTPETQFLAQSNLADEQIAAVRFYLVAHQGLTAGSWRLIAEDTDGSDGYMTKVPVDFVQLGQEYAIAAQLETATGETVVAQSDWLEAESAWPAILAAPQVDVWRGEVDVRLLPLTERERDQYYELWLQPVTDAMTRREPLYLGLQTLPADAPEGAWHAWTIDSRAIADGAYRLYATVGDRKETERISAAGQIVIDNACPPQIKEVSVSLAGRAHDRLHVEVAAEDLDGEISRVDMYLVSQSPLAPEAGEAAPIWLGSDTSGTGGWGLDTTIQRAWRGTAWAVRAIAYDDHDYPSETVTSAYLSLPPVDVQARFVLPIAASLSSGTRRVSLIFDAGIGEVQKVLFYLQDQAGTLHELGQGDFDIRLAATELDTARWAPGDYRLLAQVISSTGESVWPGPELEILASEPEVELRGPQEMPLNGEIEQQVRVRSSTESIVRAEFALRNAQAQVTILGTDATPQDGLSVHWNADALLSGAYVLVCSLTDAAGDVSVHEWPLTLGHDLALTGLVAGQRLTGAQTLSWRAEGLAEGATAEVAYSPDDGAHWLVVMEVPVADETVAIDTTTLPDSEQARFRLTCLQSDELIVADSPTVAVDNARDEPHLALLAPRSGQTLPLQATLSWEASSPDGYPLSLSVAVRQAGGNWITVASGLEDTGRFEWDTTAYVADGNWELRLTATDAAGSSCTTSAGELVLTHGYAPTVRMVWPDEDVTLNGETAILWSALDLDGDDLTIDLFYSDNGGQAWYSLAEGLPNIGYYLWETAFVPPGDAYRLRVVASDGQFERAVESSGLCDVGDAAQPQISLVWPQAGADLRHDALVCWQSVDADASLASVSVSATEKRTGETVPIAEGAALTGCAVWDTLSCPDGAYELLATGYDADGRAVARAGATVQLRDLALVVPEGAWLDPLPAAWANGLLALRWRAWAADSGSITARIETSLDEGETWNTAQEMEADRGLAYWSALPAEASTLVRLRLTDARGGQTTLTPLRLCEASAETLPEITQTLGRDERGQVVRWLVQDARDRRASVSLIGLGIEGDESLLADGLDEVGEFRLSAEDGLPELGAICVLADNAVASRLTCQPVQSSSGIVRLVAPEAGETLTETVHLAWEITDGAPAAASQMVQWWWSRDGRRSWQELAQVGAAAHSYLWDSGALPGGPIWLRASIVGQESAASTMTWGPFVLEDGTPTAASISLVGLDGVETISGALPLNWQSLGSGRVTLSYRTAPNGPWHSLAAGRAANGQYVWDALSLPNGSLIWLKATLDGDDTMVSDETDMPFRLATGQTPGVALSWTVAEQAAAQVCWQAEASRSGGQVELSYSPDGGATWTTLASELPLVGCQALDDAPSFREWPLLRATVADGSRRQAVDTISLGSGMRCAAAIAGVNGGE